MNTLPLPAEIDRLRKENAELLAVCQLIVDAVEGGDEMAVVDAARAAIAKAKVAA